MRTSSGKNDFSLRKVWLRGSTGKRQRSDSWSLVPVDEIKSSFRRSIRPFHTLGIQDKPFPDQLLYNLEGRIFRQLAEQKRRYPDLQMAVANPSKAIFSIIIAYMLLCTFSTWSLEVFYFF